MRNGWIWSENLVKRTAAYSKAGQYPSDTRQATIWGSDVACGRPASLCFGSWNQVCPGILIVFIWSVWQHCLQVFFLLPSTGFQGSRGFPTSIQWVWHQNICKEVWPVASKSWAVIGHEWQFKSELCFTALIGAALATKLIPGLSPKLPHSSARLSNTETFSLVVLNFCTLNQKAESVQTSFSPSPHKSELMDFCLD